MENKIYTNALLDFYGTLLTEKQRRICDYYFNEDYSLQEIADIEQISRSAVHDVVRRARNEMETYEEKMSLYKNYKKRMKLYQEIKAFGIKEINDLTDQCIDTEINEGENYE